MAAESEKDPGIVFTFHPMAQTVQVAPHVALGNPKAPLLCSLLLQVMRLIYDEMSKVGQDFAPSSHVGEQQGMVDNDKMSALRLSPRTIEEAIAPSLVSTLSAKAALTMGADPVPQQRLVSPQR
jgi:hypothetical protein